MSTYKFRRTRGRPEAQKQFVINSTLLSLIDPVRGEPTRSPLEDHPDDDISRSHLLKQKFLDSFALICSTSSSGKETASAVCMEQNQQSETILRLARNRGIDQEDLKKLERVLQILRATANGDKLSMEAENEVLHEVVDLDQSRLLSLVQKLEKDGIRDVFQRGISKLGGSDCNQAVLEDSRFKQWIQTCPFVTTSLSPPRTNQLAFLVKWAQESRWVYHKQLQSLFAFGSTSMPRWIENLHKLARYWGAIKSMVKLANKQPTVFARICIQDIKAPAQQSFSLGPRGSHLRKALQRLLKKDFEATINHLAQRWETDDAEEKLRRKCCLTLTLHAEMQLLDFYELNPALVPRLRLMGTSKKACYLCHEFLLRHPFRIQVSACHQKIYPTWLLPSCRRIPGVNGDDLFWKLSRHIEYVTGRELRKNLGQPQRPRNNDSTAGPSLTETATTPTEVWVRYVSRQHLPFKGDFP